MAYKSQFMMEVNASDKTKAVLTNVQNQLKKTAKTGKKGGKSVTDGWKKAVGALIAVKAAAMAIEGVFAGLQAGKQAAMVDSAFKSIHANADALLGTLREASQFAIDDTSLQTLANRWAMAGRDIDVLTRTLPHAYRIAAATGEDYLQVSEKIAIAAATGRKSALERYVGLLDETKAYKAYAQELGVSEKALTAAQKKAALVEEGLRSIAEKYGHIEVDIDAQKIDQLKKDWDDFVSNVQVGILRTAGQLADVIKGANMDR